MADDDPVEPRFLIVGTGRSGTGYIARVLSDVGVPCGHEAWWNPFNRHDEGLTGDASWCALPLGLTGYGGQVFHQVRHPLDVVSSLLKNPTTDGDYRALQSSLLPWVPVDPIDYAMLTTLVYGKAAEAVATWTWRLEDVDETLISELAARVDALVDPAVVHDVVNTVPHTFNEHGPGHRYRWVDLPAGACRDALLAWAAGWGYE